MIIDPSNSLEYRRIKDTYSCVLFVSSLTTTDPYQFLTGKGDLLPFYCYNGNFIIRDNNIVIEDALVLNALTTKLTTTNVLDTNTLISTTNTSSAYITGNPSITYSNINTHPTKLGVTDMNVQEVLSGGIEANISDVYNISSIVGWQGVKTSGTETGTKTFTFELTDQTVKETVVIIATINVRVYNDQTYTMTVFGSNGKNFITKSRIRNCTDEGGRVIDGFIFTTFICTCPPDTLSSGPNTVTITGYNIDTVQEFGKDILILHGK